MNMIEIEMNLLNMAAVEDFLDFGITAPFESLRGSGFLVGERPTPPIGFDHIFSTYDSIIEDEETAAKKLLDSICQAVDDIVSSKKVNSFAMSGGLDSRLILALLINNHRTQLAKIPIYTRVHPVLGQTDKDALVVSVLNEKYGLNVSFETPDVFPQAYLKNEDAFRNPSLSGLWGGELLGGALMKFAPFELAGIVNSPRPSGLKNFLLGKISDEQDLESGFMRLGFELVSKSGLTAMYQSPTWLYPTRPFKYSVSPFVQPEFLKTLFSIHPKLLCNYRLYAKIMKENFPEFLEVPVNNKFLRSHGILVAEEGIEPKSLEAPLKFSSHGGPIDEFQIQLLKFLDRHPDRKYSSYLAKVVHLT